MTKNVVQRLQTIQQDITSIISIYDLTNKPKQSDEELQSQKKQSTHNLPKMDASESSESTIFCNRIQPQSSTLLAPVTKNGTFFTRSSKSISSDESMSTASGESQKQNVHKPGSAPSSSSTVHQSDYSWRRLLGPSRNVTERGDPSKAKVYNNSHQTLWYDCRSCTDCEAVKTPIKALETGNALSMKNNYEESEEYKDSELEINETASKFEGIGKEDSKVFEKHKTDSVNSIALLKKEKENQSSVVEGKLSPKPERAIANKYDTLNYPMSPTTSKTLSFLKKDKPLEHPTKSPTKVPKAVKPRTPSPDAKNIKQTTKPVNFKIKKDEDGTNDSKYSSNFKLSERIYSRAKQEEKFLGDKAEEKKLEKERKLRVTCNNQKPAKIEEESVELYINETNVILSKSVEKLEKMKSSKELALSLAKQLKDKCDELRLSNEELLDKLVKAEKENKRLSTGFKATELAKKKLQSKFEELKNESKNKLTGQEMKAKKMEEEIILLKTKIQDKERQHNEELLKKQKEVEQVQKERLHEIRNAMKVRENRIGEVQRLTEEKSDLQTRVEELRNLLTRSHMKTEKLEEENRRLQEVQSQNEQLEKKKEAQEGTQQELETIRQNSKDLEEQVQTLRKSVETFDEVQKKLIKQTTEYQQQMQSGLEEIEKLKNENSKLKMNLENEKDALLIKTKIIEDQQETIKQLKTKTEEVKTLLKKNQSLERILNIEREEKLELEDAVEHLNRRKEELKKKIKCLENDLLLAPQEVVSDLQKTQVVLHELENQVQAKQKEWEFHLQCLIRQKEQACSVAEFATKKLMRTTTEFQKQTEAYKALQRLIAENMTLKEKLPCPVSCLSNTQN